MPAECQAVRGSTRWCRRWRSRAAPHRTCSTPIDLGAALATTNISFGVVNAPGHRYHPATIAQGIASLAQMFPGRFWAALGLGEASNEQVTGEVWPRKDICDQRRVECFG